ncbi:MAG: 16S rRNA (cytidine(1402)-2'-O)-methyltransferase [Erysipelotrichaceae bacterium]
MIRQKSFEAEVPTLYLVATPIGNLDEMTPRAIEILNSVDVIAAEDTRNTLHLLSHFGIKNKLVAHHMHNEKESANGLLKYLEEGKSVAVVSDAGYPLISDPGLLVTQLVIEAGYFVVPISGSSAMLNALVASGLSAQPFLFYGFLKTSTKDKTKELLELKHYPQTIIFYEAPHRLAKTLDTIKEIFGNRKMCLARELTKKHEEFIRGTIGEIIEVASDLKGEMVLVIEGCKEEKEIDMPMPLIHEKVNFYINEGCSTNEAIKRVAKEQGMSKNEIYRDYHGQNSLN